MEIVNSANQELNLSTKSYRPSYSQFFVSIIVPAYNEEDSIGNLIESLLALDYPEDRYEIIIIDNNSIDNTAAAIKKYPVVYLLEDVTQSSYAARNKGIRNAKGDILAFTDGDCVANKSWLKNAVKVLERHEADIVSGSIVFTGNKLNILALYDTIMSEDSQRIAAERGRSAGGNLAVKKEVFERIGLFDERLISGGDGEWTVRATSAGFKLEYCDSARVYHSTRSLSEVLERSIRTGFGKGQIGHLWPDVSERRNSARLKGGFCTKWISHGIEICKQRLRAVNKGAARRHLGMAKRLELNFLALFLQALVFYGWVKGNHKHV